jgi:dolichol-phosphate mannosyltransferase
MNVTRIRPSPETDHRAPLRAGATPSATSAAVKRVLVFFPTYNESGNVVRLVRAIRKELPTADLLVVDDASPDGTGQLLDDLAAELPGLTVIHRPRKLGLGSAHQIAMLHARDNDYDALITMDADFSHSPRYLPTLVEHLAAAEFVIGSRYVAGGRCDYGIGRRFISRTANFVAKTALGLKLEENTTMYRGFSKNLLRRLNIEGMRSEGYSFAVESMHQVALVTDRIAEFPIHFEHRAAGASKISQREIYRAMLTIQRLFFQQLLRPRQSRLDASATMASEPVNCCACGSTRQAVLYAASNDRRGQSIKDASPYSCATHSSRSHDEILRCLECGLIFMRPRLSAPELVEAYAEAVDPVYLENIQARIETFRYNLNQIRSYIARADRVLEIGSYCGAFLKVAREANIDVMGVEPSAWAVEASSRLSDAPVICGTTDDLPRHLGKFDVVVAWDVLEHFADPVAELSKVHRILDDRGLVIFSTLMIDNWFPRLMGKRWPWLMDMHLFYFTESTIRQILAKTGFEVVHDSNYCHIITLEYLLEKLGTLGVPLASSASALAAGRAFAKLQIPFRFGDIKLFVCKKVTPPASVEHEQQVLREAVGAE